MIRNNPYETYLLITLYVYQPRYGNVSEISPKHSGNVTELVQSMIYTTNWIKRLQKDFRRVLKMRGAMPNEDSVLVLMGKVAMDKSGFNRELPGIDRDQNLFPSEV